MKYFILFSVIIFFGAGIQSSNAADSDTLFTAFWNMENLFDTADDPLKDDAEFMPAAEKEWTEDRLDKKMYNHAQVIKLMNNGAGPDIMGYCEVEHARLMDTLAARHLAEFGYKAEGIESPDNRGIDNGFIYKTGKFKLLWIQGDTVNLPDKYPTRPIVYAGLLDNNGDTLRILINHWPSRRGGEDESAKDREAAAAAVKSITDNVLAENGNARIIIMGDFNDEPVDKSVLEVLNAQPVKCDSAAGGFTQEKAEGLYNLSYGVYEAGEGTYKYRDDWNLLDQIIVSADLIVNGNLSYLCGSFSVFKPELMVTRSGKYAGTPFPTFGGRRYLGGYSDHFPVTAKFIYN